MGKTILKTKQELEVAHPGFNNYGKVHLVKELDSETRELLCERPNDRFIPDKTIEIKQRNKVLVYDVADVSAGVK